MFVKEPSELLKSRNANANFFRFSMSSSWRTFEFHLRFEERCRWTLSFSRSRNSIFPQIWIFLECDRSTQDSHLELFAQSALPHKSDMSRWLSVENFSEQDGPGKRDACGQQRRFHRVRRQRDRLGQHALQRICETHNCPFCHPTPQTSYSHFNCPVSVFRWISIRALCRDCSDVVASRRKRRCLCSGLLFGAKTWEPWESARGWATERGKGRLEK